MIKTFTLDELILYYFNETQLTETVLTQTAIDSDEEIADEFGYIVEIFKKMEEMLLVPSEKSMEAIFSYSKNTSKQDSQLKLLICPAAFA